MSRTDLDKKIKTFEPYYKAALIKAGAKDIDPLLVSYRNRLVQKLSTTNNTF